MAGRSPTDGRVIGSVLYQSPCQSTETTPTDQSTATSPSGRTFCATRRKSTPPVHKRYTPFHAMLGSPSGSHDNGAVARDINANVMVVPSQYDEFVVKADVHSLECSREGGETNNNIIVVKGNISSFKQLGQSFLELLPSDDIEVLGSWEVDPDDGGDIGVPPTQEQPSSGTPEKQSRDESPSKDTGRTGKGKTSPRASAKNAGRRTSKISLSRQTKTPQTKQKSLSLSPEPAVTNKLPTQSRGLVTKNSDTRPTRRSARERVPKTPHVDITPLARKEKSLQQDKVTKASCKIATEGPVSEQEKAPKETSNKDGAKQAANVFNPEKTKNSKKVTAATPDKIQTMEGLTESSLSKKKPSVPEIFESKLQRKEVEKSNRKRQHTDSSRWTRIKKIHGEKEVEKTVRDKAINDESEGASLVSIGEKTKEVDKLTVHMENVKPSGKKNKRKKKGKTETEKKMESSEKLRASESSITNADSGPGSTEQITTPTDREVGATAVLPGPEGGVEVQSTRRKSKRISSINRSWQSSLEDSSDELESSSASPKMGGKVKNEVHNCKHCTYSTIFKSRLKVHTRMHTGERPFNCKKCEKSFAQRSALVVHERFHNNSRPYVCNVCERGFHTSGHLHDHSRIHSGERPFICVKCRKTFRISSHLQIHLRIHNDERLYKCDICPKSFIQSSQLKVHQKIHNREVEAKHTCDKCDKKFLLHWNLNLHMRTVHSRGHKPFQCDDCGKAFTIQNYLAKHRKHCRLDPAERKMSCPVCDKEVSKVSCRRHLMIHADSKKYVCDVCSKAFRFAHSLLTHVRVHSRETPGDCPICKMAFTDFTGMRRHYKKVHRVDPWEKKFKCSLCKNCFYSKVMLSRHLSEVHTDRRPHQCPQCGKAFKTDRNLRQHKNAHDAGSHFKCDECPQSFSQRGNLKIHIATVHEKQKNYKCNICGMSFASKRNLANHMHTHTGEKPHECPHCGQRFSQRGTLKRHERVHTGQKPYTCDVCQKGFRQNVHLVTHKKVHAKLHCGPCELQCKSTSEFRDHLRRVHLSKGRVSCVKCSAAMETDPSQLKGRQMCEKCDSVAMENNNSETPPKRKRKAMKDEGGREDKRRRKPPPSSQMGQAVSSRKRKMKKDKKSARRRKTSFPEADVSRKSTGKTLKVKLLAEIANVDNGTQTESKKRNSKQKPNKRMLEGKSVPVKKSTAKKQAKPRKPTTNDTCMDTCVDEDQQAESHDESPGRNATSTADENHSNQMECVGNDDINVLKQSPSSKATANRTQEAANRTQEADPPVATDRQPADTDSLLQHAKPHSQPNSVPYDSEAIDLTTKSQDRKVAMSASSDSIPSSSCDAFNYRDIIVIRPIVNDTESGK